MTSGAEKIIPMSREVEGLMAGLGRVGASIRICDGTGWGQFWTSTMKSKPFSQRMRLTDSAKGKQPHRRLKTNHILIQSHLITIIERSIAPTPQIGELQKLLHITLQRSVVLPQRRLTILLERKGENFKPVHILLGLVFCHNTEERPCKECTGKMISVYWLARAEFNTSRQQVSR